MSTPADQPPGRRGLYDPSFEHDACGMGLVANLHGTASHGLVDQSLTVLERLAHRGASGADPTSGDGAGIMLQIPDAFLRAEAAQDGVELAAKGAYLSGLVFLERGDSAAPALAAIERAPIP
ncbi:MAG TPA: hypothetical protein VMQ40_03110, partial [Acidimicrobiales bacterium]|nr:hypothetical protein [Acidimicrobiales bacterium]